MRAHALACALQFARAMRGPEQGLAYPGRNDRPALVGVDESHVHRGSVWSRWRSVAVPTHYWLAS